MIVYHYTTIDNLEKIITKKDDGTPVLNIHATHCLSLNDQFENTLGLTLLGKCLPKIEEELNVPSKDKLSLLLKNRRITENHGDRTNDTLNQISCL